MEKISIIVPCYNTEKYIERCLESLINQTYKNLEIIVVDDATPDNSIDIVKIYQENDSRIKIVKNEKNKGLYLARLAGAEIATGDYIAFVDSDDYVELDFYRELVESLKNTNADFVFSNTVIEDKNNRYVYNLFKTGKKELNGKEIMDEYFAQEGLNYRWHTVWNKLYKMSLWKKSVEEFKKFNKHLIMTEDFIYSTILFSKAQKCVYNDRANYFYCSNDDASTSLNKLNEKKFIKNVGDVISSFNFVENYLKSQNTYSEHKTQFEKWKSLYKGMWEERINLVDCDRKIKEIILKQIDEFDCDDITNPNKNIFYKHSTKWNDGLIKIKEQIIKHNVISFDIFDTLILRPFLEPKDLFIFLDKKYMELSKKNGLLLFSKIRSDAEKEVRKLIFLETGQTEVTIDEIYDFINNKYLIDNNILNQIKKYEKELEINFCYARETTNHCLKWQNI